MIEIDGVSKVYKLYERPGDRLKDAFTFGRHLYREHWALHELSLEINRGETFCIIGENGSGKSTLLKLIAGILQPTTGAVRVRGRLTALLELGAGFNHEFTGRQNLFLNGAILGLTPREIERSLGGILDFAEIGSYIDQPVKTYSSGMVVRLGFAMAVQMQPDILVVDEALAVGDIYFRHRCMRKIHELRERGVTIVYVTHEISEIKELGHRVLWLEHGRVRELGEVGSIANRYLVSLLDKDAEHWKHHQSSVLQQPRILEAPPEVIAGISPNASRYGDGSAEMVGIEVTDREGQPVESVRTPAEIVVRVSVRAREVIERPIAGVLIRTEQELDLSGSNTARQNIPIAPMIPGEIRTFDFHFRLPELAPAFYTFTCGFADGDLNQYRMCDLVERAARIRILAGEKPVTGYMHLPCVVHARREPHESPFS